MWYRRIFVSGASLAITLPKPWLRDRNLRRGDYAECRVMPDGSLHISYGFIDVPRRSSEDGIARSEPLDHA